MSAPRATVEKTYDGHYAVYTDGTFRFAGSEDECYNYVRVVIMRPRVAREQRDALLGRALGY